jgi:hypothetical protein
VLVGNHEQPLHAALKDLTEAGHEAIAVTCDVADVVLGVALPVDGGFVAH